MALQRQLESNAYVLGGSSYEAPGQLVGDFIAGRPSTQLGQVLPSYKPGVHLTDLGTAFGVGFATRTSANAALPTGKRYRFSHPVNV